MSKVPISSKEILCSNCQKNRHEHQDPQKLTVLPTIAVVLMRPEEKTNIVCDTYNPHIKPHERECTCSNSWPYCNGFCVHY